MTDLEKLLLDYVVRDLLREQETIYKGQSFIDQPLGMMTKEGRIIECPHCGKNAVEKKVYDQLYYNHGTYSVPVNNSSFGIVSFFCPRQPKETPEENSPK